MYPMLYCTALKEDDIMNELFQVTRMELFITSTPDGE